MSFGMVGLSLEKRSDFHLGDSAACREVGLMNDVGIVAIPFEKPNIAVGATREFLKCPPFLLRHHRLREPPPMQPGYFERDLGPFPRRLGSRLRFL